MLKGFKKVISQYAFLILPICTLLCLVGFIGSYLFPNEVLDTYQVNVTEEEGDEEFVLNLTGAEDEIGYVMTTDGRALKGFQIGISKNGAALEGTELVYRVYGLPEEGSSAETSNEELPLQLDPEELNLILEKSYDLGTCLDGQYPYLPFDEEDLCSGKLYITFTYRANGNTEGILPGIFANHRSVENAATYINGKLAVDNVNDGEPAADNINGGEQPPMIKNYYIYSHDTYPLLYDCRVLTFVFLAASMTVCYPKWKSRKGEKREKKEGKADAV